MTTLSDLLNLLMQSQPQGGAPQQMPMPPQQTPVPQQMPNRGMKADPLVEYQDASAALTPEEIQMITMLIGGSAEQRPNTPVKGNLSAGRVRL